MLLHLLNFVLTNSIENLEKGSTATLQRIQNYNFRACTIYSFLALARDLRSVESK